MNSKNRRITIHLCCIKSTDLFRIHVRQEEEKKREVKKKSYWFSFFRILNLWYLYNLPNPKLGRKIGGAESK